MGNTSELRPQRWGILPTSIFWEQERNHGRRGKLITALQAGVLGFCGVVSAAITQFWPERFGLVTPTRRIAFLIAFICLGTYLGAGLVERFVRQRLLKN